MKKIVLYIDSMYRGGAQRVMANLANYFWKIGNEVILINDFQPSSDRETYEVDFHVKRVYLSESYESNNKIKMNVMRIKALRKTILEEKPDVVLSFLGAPNIRMLLATLLIDTKKIVSVRNDPYREYGEGYKKRLANLLFILADGIVFQTEEAREYFGKNVKLKSKIIYNPVHEKFFEQSRNHVEKEIAVVGRFQPQKNHVLAIKAFSIFLKSFPEYKMVFYGEGELENQLKEIVRELEIEDSVVFYGMTTQMECKLVSTDIFLMTSDYEGMPNAMMEAMAVGMPIVATDCPCGGPRTLIQSGVQGLLVECNNVMSVTDALLFLAKNPEKKMEMAHMAQKRAEEFKSEHILGMWNDYIKGICDENKHK